MGDIADDMVNGLQCHWCGVCFEKEHGYPVVCENCWKNDEQAAKNAGLQKATEKEL